MQGTNDNRTSTSSLRPGHVRTVALAATIVGVVVLPIAAANANPLHSGSKQPSVTGTPATGSPATATALLPQYCGSTESGFSGQITAQVCVLNSNGVVTGTVFVANSTAKPLTVGINLTRDGSFANMTCTVVAHDANGECTTGPLSLSSGAGAFDAIAEAVPVNAPVADGVLRADSGEVTLSSAGAAASASASASASTESSPAAATPTTTPTGSASASASPSAS